MKVQLSLHSKAENVWKLTSTSPIHLRGVRIRHRGNFIFTILQLYLRILFQCIMSQLSLLSINGQVVMNSEAIMLNEIINIIVYIRIHLLCNAMEQSPSWEANSHSACQEIPIFLYNPKLHYSVHMSRPLDPILSQINPIQPLISTSLK
jgi:hypothetical protein